MPAQPPRVFSREFKEGAVRRILAGEKVRAVAAELQVWPKLLYHWWGQYDRGGPEALLPPGRPRGSTTSAARARGPGSTPARQAASKRRAPTRRPGDMVESERVAELERKVGQQALELDFFDRALRYIKASAPPSDARGARASSP